MTEYNSFFCTLQIYNKIFFGLDNQGEKTNYNTFETRYLNKNINICGSVLLVFIQLKIKN
jgi:hypothetical protein